MQLFVDIFKHNNMTAHVVDSKKIEYNLKQFPSQEKKIKEHLYDYHSALSVWIAGKWIVFYHVDGGSPLMEFYDVNFNLDQLGEMGGYLSYIRDAQKAYKPIFKPEFDNVWLSAHPLANVN